MSEKTDFATAQLARHKRIYQFGLAQVDKYLESAVAQSPADLTTARGIQNAYVTGLGGRQLLPGGQPTGTTFDMLQMADGPITAALV